MYLIINGYEFGQWLCILLWVGLPVTMFLTMWASWFNYRRGRMAAHLLLTVEGLEEGGGFSIGPEDLSKDLKGDSGDGWVDTERSVKVGEEDYKENLYKGILWMKEKYEQYRDLADERYERLKDQLTEMERKYEDLLTKVQGANEESRDEEVARLRYQLEEKERMNEELVIKLRSNSQLLLNIYQELDKSLHFSDTPAQG